MKIAIPARYASTRFPGKPLALIAGEPMIKHVWRRAVAAAGSERDVFVATDDVRIAACVRDFGGQVCMTSETHENGTERLAELVDTLALPDDDIIVNVQGDEPLIDPALIRLVGSLLAEKPEAHLATAADVAEPEMADNPNVVKVVLDKQGTAHYFSRAAIPYSRENSGVTPLLRHIGIYAYRASTLRTLKTYEPAPTEQAEKLEQLRALWHGMKIAVALYDGPPAIGVDQPDDIARVETLLAENCV